MTTSYQLNGIITVLRGGKPAQHIGVNVEQPPDKFFEELSKRVRVSLRNKDFAGSTKKDSL